MEIYKNYYFAISVSEDEENLAIVHVRVVWAVQSCHLSTQLSRSLDKGAHGSLYNLQKKLDSRLYYNHACPQNHVNSQNKQGALGQSEC